MVGLRAMRGSPPQRGEVTHHRTLDLQSAFQSKVSQVVQYIFKLTCHRVTRVVLEKMPRYIAAAMLSEN